VVAAGTLVAGVALLTAALRIQPGDPLFYLATMALAVVWSVGALASGPLHLGQAHTRAGRRHARPVVQSLALGALLLALFLLGALLVARIPLLRNPVQHLLDHARLGSLPLVVALTAVNGVAEELYFRGALYAAVGRRHAVATTTAVYALTTVGSGIPLLVLAAAALGLLTALQRRVTGGILGPAITHVTWSLGMLFLLPLALDLGS
jgi:membrane protease YdiL (CAAX protease family)